MLNDNSDENPFTANAAQSQYYCRPGARDRRERLMGAGIIANFPDWPDVHAASRSAGRGCPGILTAADGAVEKTRTSTAFRPQRPQRCASTSSATTARHEKRRQHLPPDWRGGPLAKAVDRRNGAEASRDGTNGYGAVYQSGDTRLAAACSLLPPLLLQPPLYWLSQPRPAGRQRRPSASFARSR